MKRYKLSCVKLGKAAQLKRREDELEDRLARPQWIAMDSNGWESKLAGCPKKAMNWASHKVISYMLLCMFQYISLKIITPHRLQ